MATAKTPSEQRVVLHNIGWATYERLLADSENNSTPRFAYDRGELEIMSPSPEHEKFNRRIAQLVLAVAEELGIEAEDLGSATFRREDLERGFEPDSCLYIQNEEEVRGKDRIDPDADPPSIYTQMGVPEVWRYDGERMTILVFSKTPTMHRLPKASFSGSSRKAPLPVSSRRASL
jgi:Uma2 family endonuclease